MPALDLTPAFDELLVKGDSKPTRKHVFNAAHTNGFLKEAYRISTHISTLSKQLGDVRQAYLSSAPSRRSHASHTKSHKSQLDHQLGSDGRDLFLSDAQRDDIDANAKRLLRDLNASIKGLAEAETLHQETQQILIRKKHGFGGGGRLAGLLASKSYEQAAAEDAQRQMAAHHESVLWFLRQRLQACGQHYESTLGKVRSAEQSLVEIAELQTMLVSNLEMQSAHVDQMVQDSFNTADNVAKGNQELKKALDRPSTARYTFFVACSLSLFVVVWDFLI
ncbi:snare protein syntaxin 18 ufe1 [Ophiostoma piceae UAMH 11346]|uniref:Snare protein syntaxin 18 ufe1 n=1 Tax=Ophiostoma piceae (strain UAMH 11346) TaxID=1262450 RepID=S3DB15_OPHP1|nr:snare protein syntaxin 18 ufe1 [Ophiostoma piceae UAMH 11346]